MSTPKSRNKPKPPMKESDKFINGLMDLFESFPKTSYDFRMTVSKELYDRFKEVIKQDYK